MDKRLIGLFNDGFPPIMDGVSLTVKNYAYWLNQKNENVCVVTPKIPGTQYTEKYPIYSYTSIPIPMRKPYRLGFPRIDLPFYEHICQKPFSLVHAHCPFSSGELAMRIAHSQHIPIIATFHSKYRDDFKRIIPNKTLLALLIRKIIRFYEAADEVWIPQAAVEDTIREYGYNSGQRNRIFRIGRHFDSKIRYAKRIKHYRSRTNVSFRRAAYQRKKSRIDH